MKITIDVSPIIYGTGVAYYIKNLVRGLLEIDKENEYMLFGGSLRRFGELKGEVKALSDRNSRSEEKTLPLPPLFFDLLWNRVHFIPAGILVGKTQVFHSSDWTQPKTKAFKVTTVHDLIPIKFPKIIDPKIVGVHKRRLHWVKKEVDKVIVPSQETAKDLNIFGVESKKIVVIPEASTASKASSLQVAGIKRQFKISGNYLLGVGLSLYKNTERIIKAFDLVRAGEDLKLVLLGREKDVAKFPERRDVRFVHSLDNAKYSALVTGAEALVFPSLYEGFGLPILDAFSCGTPVVTSNLSTMPEVAGGAAVLVDPYKVESISEGIRKVLDKKQEFRKMGFKRVREFSWEKTARETLEIYKGDLEDL